MTRERWQAASGTAVFAVGMISRWDYQDAIPKSLGGEQPDAATARLPIGSFRYSRIQETSEDTVLSYAMADFDGITSGPSTTLSSDVARRAPASTSSVRPSSKSARQEQFMPAHFSEGPRLRILVVEDDPEALALTLELLEDLGHWAAGVRSAEAALARFLEGAFDVLLIDIGLPALSGCELAERLRAGVRIPIVFATGREEPKRIMPDTIWLRKPYSVEQLENALARAAKFSVELDRRAPS